MHIVPNDFEIPVNGILGKDFLKAFECNIDYATMSLTFSCPDSAVIIDILQGSDDDTLVIPPRCEVKRHLKENFIKRRPSSTACGGLFWRHDI